MISSANGVEVTELVKWKRRIKIRAIKDGPCSKFIRSFCSMYSIPANIILWVAASCGCYSASINNLRISAENFSIKIIGTITMPTTSLGTILKPCPQYFFFFFLNIAQGQSEKRRQMISKTPYHVMWDFGTVLVTLSECQRK